MSLLPNNYKFDKTPIVGETFEKLHPVLISKADFVICKLLIDETKRRLHDLQDIKNLVIDKHDADRIVDKFNDISFTKQSVALKAEGLFKQIRQEYVVNNDGLPYSNSDEIAFYTLKRYGLTASSSLKEQWNDELDQMIKKPAIIIGEIDYNAGKEIAFGNNEIAARDRGYRADFKKAYDYGMEL